MSHRQIAGEPNVEVNSGFCGGSVSDRFKIQFSRSVLTAVLLFAVACGKDNSQGLPTAPPPPGTGGTTDLPTAGLPNDPRVPALLAKAVEIKLVDSVNFTGLQDLAQTIFAPLVQTFVALEIVRGRETEVSGSILVGFEDSEGFWGALLNTFAGASQRSSTSLDMIFSDSELSVRMVSGLNADTMVSPTLYYRLRKSGEKQCQTQSLTCTQTQYTCTSWDWYSGACKNWTSKEVEVDCSTVPGAPTPPTAAQLAAECRTYMNLGNSSVKKLGTFESNYSKWVK